MAPRLFLTLLLLFGTHPAFARKHRAARLGRFEATAHSVEGVRADGGLSRPGTVAADPSVLALGSVIRVTGAGKYSGRYLVADTGAKVNGRHIDIYLPNDAEARRFGKKRVTVHLISRGKPARVAARR